MGAIHEVVIVYNPVLTRRSSKEQVLESAAARWRVVGYSRSGNGKAILPAKAADEEAMTVALYCRAESSENAGSPANWVRIKKIYIAWLQVSIHIDASAYVST